MKSEFSKIGLTSAKLGLFLLTVTGDCTSQNDDQVSDSEVHQLLVNCGSSTEANRGEDNWSVQRNTIVSTTFIRIDTGNLRPNYTYTSSMNHEPAVPRRIFPFFHVE
jgi:hypothetical protein